jgi:general secretion pathway protein J
VSNARGFTLLEMLIGMTLLGLIMALLLGGFRLASSSWDAAEVQSERTADDLLGRMLVRRLVTEMQPLRWNRAVNRPITMAGEREVLRAVAPLSGQAGVGGLRVIELRVERLTARQDVERNGNAPMRLMLRHAPVRYDASSFADSLGDAPGQLVVGELDAVVFSYFGPERRGEAPRWQEVWTNPDQLPRLVRLHLQSKDAGWADMVIAPMVTVNRGGAGVVTVGGGS